MMDNPIFYLTRVMWRFAAGNRPQVVLYCIFFIISNAISLLSPIVVAHIMNVIQAQGIQQGNVSSILWLLVLLPLLDIAFWAFHGPARVMEMTNSFLVRANYRQYLLSGTMALPMEWHVEHHSGDTIDKVNKGSEAIFQFTSNGFQIIESIVRFIGSLIAIAIFNLNAIFLVLFIVTVAIRIMLVFDKKLIKQYRELNTADNHIAAKIYDALSNISTVIILRVEQLIEQDVVRAIRKPFALFVRSTRLTEWKWFTASMSAGFLQFFVIAIYIIVSLRSGVILLAGTTYVLFTYTNRINDVFFTFAYLYNGIVRQRTAVQNAEEISAVFPVLIDPESQVLHKWEECHVHHLNFSYDLGTGAERHLSNVEMSWRKGEKIAVIGESGSGKTTFLKIVRGLYIPQTGVVELDGKLLPHGFQSLSEDIALIPQEPEIFATTVRDNVTMGVDRSDEETIHFITEARFLSVLKRLPEGLDTSVVEKGVNLSGGEKQRLALARGLMASEDKSILLLDESTSSVDANNEMTIYENIFQAYQDKTIIASIHRLHLLQKFDTIYLFENGSIVARGTFDELLQNSKSFSQQWERYTHMRKS